MNKISYNVAALSSKFHDAAYVAAGEDPLGVLIESAIQTLSTDIKITCGGVTMHLAAWQDPEHWSDDWAAEGIEAGDVWGFVSAQMIEATQ